MENLGLDIKLLVAQIINFGLFFFIFKKLIAGPFVAMIKEEKKKDAERRSVLDELAKQKETLAQEQKSARQEAHKKMEISLAEARKAAEREKSDLIKKAQEEAAEIVKRGKRQVEDEQRQLEMQYKENVAKVGIMTVENTLRDFLSADMQKQVTAKVLSNLQQK